MAPRIRPHVQSKYCSPDPYSPLTLVVPEGLSPPWRDCFIEGQKDVLHGGALSKALVQNAKLKQCSRYGYKPVSLLSFTQLKSNFMKKKILSLVFPSHIILVMLGLSVFYCTSTYKGFPLFIMYFLAVQVS